MSWLRIDDRFEDHEKVEPLSDAAHRLWFRCACWCKKSENLRLGGLVPLRQVVKFCAGSERVARKLATELVDARGDAAFGHEHGLWEPRESAWQFHDWEKYQPAQGSDPSASSPNDPIQRSEAARRAGIASADARRRRDGTAQPARRTDSERTPERPERRSTERTPNGLPNEAPTSPRTAFDRTDSERTPERPEPPDPDPRSQSGSAAEDLSEDLTGFPRETPRSEPAAAATAGDSVGVADGDETLPSSLTAVPTVARKYELALKNPGVFALEHGVRWPEFMAVWLAWGRPFGITELPHVTQRIDRDIMAVIEALASGKTVEQLVAAGKAAETDEYFKGLTGGGPASFTPAVLRRLLAPPRAVGAARGRRNGPPQPDHGKTGWEGQE
jgi:hypothetical protein